jgi:hypothetical protein
MLPWMAYNITTLTGEHLMQFENISNTATSELNGSHRQGEIQTSYNTLVELFGKHSDGDGEKVQVEWVLKFEDGTIATIYDWKWYGTHYTEVPEWNIGGFSKDAVERVKAIIEKK